MGIKTSILAISSYGLLYTGILSILSTLLLPVASTYMYCPSAIKLLCRVVDSRLATHTYTDMKPENMSAD